MVNRCKPILKWAGGKSQLLNELIPRIPAYTGKYIEPFFGGGALYLAVKPEKAVISDSNPELINLYVQVTKNLDKVIKKLKQYENTEEMFYEVRALDWMKLPPEEAAARTIYLNRTCFNGLYRVNKKGQFNTPFGRYKNPRICDEEGLREASEALKNAQIVCGDYLNVLHDHARAGDFIFLDPPYIPMTKWGDFKRYTKEQFYEEDQENLAEEVKRLQRLGCYVLLTNSNHEKIHELYSDFKIDEVATKRLISAKPDARTGEDAIVTAFPNMKKIVMTDVILPEQASKYPATRYMGSKSKLIKDIISVAGNFEYNSVIDLFSGSGIVGYTFKSLGKKVISNDYMAMSATFTKAMVENNSVILTKEEAEELLNHDVKTDGFVENRFKGLFFTDEDNRLIDRLRTNIWNINGEYKRAIAMTALIRACMKKRPRGLFTYVGMGEKYNDGRRDLQISMAQQFLENVEFVNSAVFDNGCQNQSIWGDAMNVESDAPDMVYIDPPYYSPLSDNEYVRRYHFVEGLARDWKGVEFQDHTKTKKFKSYPTPFASRNGAAEAFDSLFSKYKSSIIIVSYSSNSQPTKEEMIEIMERHKNNVEVVPIDYTYFFGNQAGANSHRNSVQEYLFVGY